MILFLSDLHCRFELVNVQIEHAERSRGRNVDAVVLLGDLGLFEPVLGNFFRRKGERFARPLYFIEGNHEDFDRFPFLVDRYRDVMTHLPRGTVHEIAGLRCLALGGAAYMDAQTTPAASVITRDHIERCLEHSPQDVDAVLTHDCPVCLGIPNRGGFDHYGPTGFPESPALLSHFRPRLWFFGHHHRWFSHEGAGTRFYGLAQSWRGYGLLHEDWSFDMVESEIEMPPSLWQRVRERMRTRPRGKPAG